MARTLQANSRVWTALVYGAMLAGAVLIFFVINSYGRTLLAPEPAALDLASRVGATVKPDALLHVLVALTAVLIVGRVLSAGFRFIGQPPVIGEVVGGILL